MRKSIQIFQHLTIWRLCGDRLRSSMGHNSCPSGRIALLIAIPLAKMAQFVHESEDNRMTIELGVILSHCFKVISR